MAGIVGHGWYSSNYKYRIPITVDYTAIAAADGTFAMTIPSDHELFWANVRSDGKDMVLTMADGVTELADSATYWDTAGGYGWDAADASGTAFNTTNRTGGIRAKEIKAAGYSTTGSPLAYSMYNVLWLYFGYASEASAHTVGTYSGATNCTATTETWHPDRCSPRIRTRPELPGATAPAAQIAKAATETIDLFWDLRGELHQRQNVFKGKYFGDSIRGWTYESYAGGAAAAVEVAANGALIGSQGGVIRNRATGGTTGTDYTLALLVYTTSGRVLDRRAILRVNTPDEQ